MTAADHDAVNRAVDWIQRDLRVDPAAKGVQVGSYWFFSVDPLGVWFVLNEGDRKVEIVSVVGMIES